MIKVKQSGNFKNLERLLKNASGTPDLGRFLQFGEEGLRALRDATPVDSGLTAASWAYNIEYTKEGVRITWTNSNVVNGVPIAIILDSGHGTKNGGFVAGRHYIDPAIQPVFDHIAESMWKELVK